MAIRTFAVASFTTEAVADTTGMTNSHRYAWRGTERQLQALRRRYPKTANLIASVE